MRSVLLITNPAAARTRTHHVASVRAILESDGFTVSVARTEGIGHATELARRGVADGVDVVAVHGGDGTVIQAVAGMIDSGVPLALIPGGTGNLLAGNLRLPRRPRQAARAIASGTTRNIDLGRFESDGSVRYFAVACGAGFDADLMAGTTGEAKARWGFGAYVLQVIRMIPGFAPQRYRVTVDDHTEELEAAIVLVANCREIIPPLLSLGSNIDVDDGRLDLVILNARGMLQSAGVVMRLLLRGRDNAFVRRFAGQTVRVEALSGARVAQLDGEPDAATPFRATILPRALRVIVPGG